MGEVARTIGGYRGTTIVDLPTPIMKLRGTMASWSLIPGTGMMLLPQQSGILVGKKQTIVESVYPTAQEYESAPIYKERVFAFKPRAGMGEREQSSTADQRYHYGLDIWVLGGLIGKGPLLHPLLPPATGPIRQLIDGLSQTTRTATVLYLLAGENVDVRNDDTSAGHTVLLNRPGRIAQSAVRFESFGTLPVDAVYVAWDDGELTQIGGATVVCALPTGMHANYVEKIGRELWIADATASVVRSTTNDPTIAGSWSGPIQVGDPSVPITCLRAAGGKLWILKSNGDVFSLNADGTDNDWFPSERVPLDLTNGRTASAWLGQLWFRAGPTFYKMDPSGPSLQPIGPERNMDNASEVQGPVQAFEGWGAHMAFCAIYNPYGTQTSSGQPTSYLLTYGNWQPQSTIQPTGPSLAFVDQYDGAIAHWPNRQITALYVTSVTDPPRLCVGFADGGYDWIKLVPNPLTPGSGAEFTLSTSRVVLPNHTDMFEANRKQFVAVSAFGPLINWGDNVTANYRIRGSTGAPGPMGNPDWHPILPSITNNGMRVDMPNNIAGVACEFAFDFANLSQNESPVFEGFGIHERVVPDFRYDWTATIDASDFVARKDGAAVRQNGRKIRDVIKQISGQPMLGTVELPDETIEGLAFVQYTERLLPHTGQGARFGQQFAIDLQLTQFSSQVEIGIIGRLRGNVIGDLRGYAISDLETM